MGCARSPFRDFESYLRVVVGLDQDDVRLVWKRYDSNFVSYEIPTGFYTINDISEAVYRKADHEGTLRIEYDDISRKKPILTFYGYFWNFKVSQKLFNYSVRV